MAAAGRPRGGHGETPAAIAGANGECRADPLVASTKAGEPVLDQGETRMVRASVCTGHDTSTPGAWPRASSAGRRRLWRRWGREDQPLTDERASDEPDSRTLRECGEELVGPADAPLGIVAERHAHDHRRRGAGRRVATLDVDRLDERAKVVRDGGLALPARSRQNLVVAGRVFDTIPGAGGLGRSVASR